MTFLISDTFTDSLARLTGGGQKQVKTTAFDLQMNPAVPGLSVHRLDQARDKSFWSVCVNAHVRIIVHRTAGALPSCARLPTTWRTAAARWLVATDDRLLKRAVAGRERLRVDVLKPDEVPIAFEERDT